MSLKMGQWSTVRVEVIESERGYGQSVIEHHEFPDEKTADEFVKSFNNKHCPPTNNIPDYYMQARIVG